MLWRWALVLLVAGACAEECVEVMPDGGLGCHGFADVAVHKLNATGRDPQEATADFCLAHAVESCDALFESVRSAAYAGLRRVVSAARESRYEYDEGGRRAWDGHLEVSIDRRRALEVEKDAKRATLWVGPEEASFEAIRGLGLDETEAAAVRNRVAAVRKDICDRLRRPCRKSNDTLADARSKLRGCRRLFVDLGAHDGGTLRAFYAAAGGPLGDWVSRRVDDPGSFRALAVEPSPDFPPVDDPKVVWLGGYAASDVYGSGRMFFGDQSQVGNSLRMEAPDVYVAGRLRSAPVRLFRLADFLADLMDDLDDLVVKIDIEGAEYVVVRDLLSSGVLCSRAAGANISLLVEDHAYMRPFFDAQAPPDALRAYAHALRACGVDVDLDDHTD